MSTLTLPVRLTQGTTYPETWGYADVAAAITRTFDARLAPADQSFDVLEAGGGSDCHLPLPSFARITTIDISADALALNTYAHEKLHGDIQDFDFGPRRYDVIIIWDVLEHVPRPAAALTRLAGALKPSGRIVIVGPVTSAFKSVVARLTPHAVHVAFYKHVLGVREAGQPGWPPFAVEHAHGADAQDVISGLQSAGLTIDVAEGFESVHIAALARKSRIGFMGYRCAEWLVSVVSFGRVTRGMTDFYVVARR
jgi:SAM-dependent methyltransferase